MRWLIIALTLGAALLLPPDPSQWELGRYPQAHAQASGSEDIGVLKRQLSVLESRKAPWVALATLFGAFCALWAQNTRRNALLWFLFGAVIGPIAALVVLFKNRNVESRPLPPASTS